MLSVKPFTSGDLSGSIYDFPEVGDVLPMHFHPAGEGHLTMVMIGPIRAHSTNGWDQVLESGRVIDWMPNDPHEFVAMVAGARMTNIRNGA